MGSLGVLANTNHRIAEVGRDLWRSLHPSPQLKARWAGAGRPGVCAVRFWLSPGTKTPQPLRTMTTASELDERQEPWSSEGQLFPEEWELGAQRRNAGGRAGTSPARPQPHGTRASRVGPGTAAGTSRESGSPDRRVAMRQLRGQAGKSACGSGSGSTGSIARHRHGCDGPTDGHTYRQLGREPRRWAETEPPVRGWERRFHARPVRTIKVYYCIQAPDKENTNELEISSHW